MNDILIHYMFPAAISLLALYALFVATLRNETFFGWNRLFLITAIVVSFILPLLHIPIPLHIHSSDVVDIYASSPTSEATVVADVMEKSSPALWLTLGKKLLLYVYMAGVIMLTLRLLTGLFKILYVIRQNGIVSYQNRKVVFMRNNIPHFSFFNLIFINRNFLENGQEELVFVHEKEHLRQRHFIDLILLELLIIVQWFNPAAWMYRRSLKGIHEYQADHAVLNHGYTTQEYMYLIVKQISGFRPDVFINKFNFFTLKKRIIMMSKKESSVWAKSRILLAAPIIAVLLLCFGFQANSQEYDSYEKAAVTINGMLFNSDADETTEFVSMKHNGGFSILQDSVAFEDTQTVAFHSKDNNQTAIVSLENDDVKVNVTMEDPAKQKPQKEDDVFVIVDHIPEYPGGDDARLNFLREHVTYPQEAKDKGIQGTVFVNFIVEKDGSISNVKIAKSLDKSCDEECIRVTKLMPKWKPGKQKGKIVRVSYNMPIKFTLAPKEDKEEKEEEVFVIVDQNPEYPGGDEARLNFLREHLKYPQEAKNKGIQGMVYVNFIVEKDGSISNVKIAKSLDKSCDEECIRVIKLMPKWIPGKQKGKAVRVTYNMPIKFTIPPKEDEK